MALPVKALKAGQESYWLDQIARNREEYFSGPESHAGSWAAPPPRPAWTDRLGRAGAGDVPGPGPGHGEVRCAPLLRADPRSKLPPDRCWRRSRTRAAEQQAGELEELAQSKALKGDVRSVAAARRLGGAKRVKVETVERLCRKVLGTDPRELYGEGFDQAWQHRGKRVNERVQAFDHCFSPKSVSLLAAGAAPRPGGCWPTDAPRPSRSPSATWNATASASAATTTDGPLPGGRGLVAVAFEHRMSRSGDPNLHTHVLVQNAAQGPDGRWTALDSDRLYAQLMAADHLYLAAERARSPNAWGPLGTGGRTLRRGRDPAGRPDTDRAVLQALGADRPVAGHPRPVRHQGVQRGGGGDPGAQGPLPSPRRASMPGGELSLRSRGWASGSWPRSARGRGRPASRTELDAVLDALAGPDGLTGQVSTFTRTDVVDALAKRLGRPLRSGSAQPGRGGGRPVPGRAGDPDWPRPPAGRSASRHRSC